MKTLTWSFITTLILLFSSASNAEVIIGNIIRDQSGMFINIKGRHESTKFTLRSSSTTNLIHLGKLETNDSIVASGSLDSVNKIAHIDIIEFVGLKKILGRWHSEGKVFDFKNFTDLNLYKDQPPLKTAFRYSTTPADGNYWTLLLSDTNNKRTFLATINFSNPTATLKLIDSETGEISKTFLLSRRGDLHVRPIAVHPNRH